MYNRVRTILRSKKPPDPEKYEMMCVLGWSDDGRELNKHRRTESGHTVAMKRLPLKSSTDIGVPIMTLRRISLLKEINHPNVASLVEIECNETEGRVDVMLEHRDMDLRMFMARDPERAADRKTIRKVLRQILHGVNCYHSINVAHGNLNPFNVLINIDNCDATVTDLDIAIKPSYLAPEILLNTSGAVEISMAADVFAVGCIFAEMLRGKPLFKGQTPYDEGIDIFQLLGDPESYPCKETQAVNKPFPSSIKTQRQDKITPLQKRIPNCKPSAIDLLFRMLPLNPRARITVGEALKHPYFDRKVQITASAMDYILTPR